MEVISDLNLRFSPVWKNLFLGATLISSLMLSDGEGAFLSVFLKREGRGRCPASHLETGISITKATGQPTVRPVTHSWRTGYGPSVCDVRKMVWVLDPILPFVGILCHPYHNSYYGIPLSVDGSSPRARRGGIKRGSRERARDGWIPP